MVLRAMLSQQRVTVMDEYRDTVLVLEVPYYKNVLSKGRGGAV
jgi:hypothetical protein